MKAFSFIATVVVSTLIGHTLAAPVANVVAKSSDLEDRGLVS